MIHKQMIRLSQTFYESVTQTQELQSYLFEFTFFHSFILSRQKK